MRCFVAVPVGEGIRRRVGELQGTLRRVGADVKWVEEENLHLTLKFLGEMEEAALERLRGLLSAEASRWGPLAVEYSGTGVFPGEDRPRVVWVGVRGDVEKLAGLAAAVERAAAQVGVPREGRPFVAHLTVGRVRSPRHVPRLAEALRRCRESVFGRDEIREFLLFRSTLTPSGPVYEPLGRFPLGGC